MGQDLSVANHGSGPQNFMVGRGTQYNYNYGANRSPGEQQDYKIMSLLSETNYQEHKNRNPKRVHGTCEWFLSHPMFRKWRDEDTPGLLLVSADPGCGKSVLSRAVVDERLLHPKTTLPTNQQTCYFFFTRDDENCRTKEAALRAILHQLFKTCPELREYGREGLSNHGEYFHTNFEVLWDILMKATADPKAGQTTCILDALDECKEDARKNLIDELCDFYSNRGTTKSKIKFLVTTRPYNDITSRFRYKTRCLPPINLRGEDEDIGEKISEEIDMVIDDEIPRLAGAYQPVLDEKTQATLREQLKVKARDNRTYLWLHVMLEELRDSHTPSLWDLTNMLKSLPTRVEDAYERLLNRDTKRVKKQLRQQFLHIIIAARRPLTLQEVKVSMELARKGKLCKSMDDLKLDLRDEIIAPEIRSVCSLFVRVVGSKVYLIHQTARDFLIHRDIEEEDAAKDPSDGKESTPSTWKHSLKLETSNFVMAKVCISYLLLPVLEDSPRTYGNAEEFTKKHVLLRYAVKYWLLHFQEAGDVEPALLVAATDLFDTDSGKLREWHLESLYGGESFMFLYVDGITGYASDFQLADAFRKRVEKTRDIKEEETHDETVLDDSARNESKTAVSALLENGWNIEYADCIGWHTLHFAAWEGHDAIIKQLLENGANIEVKDIAGQTALHKAAEKGHLPTVRLLLENAADIKAEDHAGNTAVTMAAWDGHEAVLRLLLGKGVDIETRHNPEKTGLFGAVVNGHESVVKLLVEAGAHINASGTEGNTCLGTAAKRGLDKMVRLLLKNNADIEAKDNEGCTPLYLAASAAALHHNSGYENVIQMLIMKGANIEATNKTGQTALHAAYRDEKITRLLLKHGACVNAKMVDGKTALHEAAKRRNEGVLQALIENDAKIDEMADDGQTALHVAASTGNTAIVQFLVKNGADINAKADNGWTALHHAAVGDNTAIVQFLVKSGADIDVKAHDRWTALDLATLKDNTGIMQFLIWDQDGVNAKQGNCTTAVRMGARNGSPAVEPLLMESGSKINAKTNDGGTAKSTARTSCHIDAVQLPSQDGQTLYQPAERETIDATNDCSTPPEPWTNPDFAKDLEDAIRSGLEDLIEGEKRIECGLGGGPWRSVILRRHGEEALPGTHLFPTQLDAENIPSDVQVFQGFVEGPELSLGNLDHSHTMLDDAAKMNKELLDDLANTLKDQGQLDDAAIMFKEVLEKRKRTLGEEHPDTISVMNSLAITLGDQGQLDDAAKMFKEVLEKKKRILGEEHPDTIFAMNNLANAQGYQGKLEESIAMFKETYIKLTALLGNDHPKTRVVCDNLTRRLLQRFGQLYEEIDQRSNEELCQQTLCDFEQTFGSQHASTVSLAKTIAKVYLLRCMVWRQKQGAQRRANLTGRKDNERAEDIIVDLTILCEKFGAVLPYFFSIFGRFLIWAGQDDDAVIAFHHQFRLAESKLEQGGTSTECDGCGRRFGACMERFVCKACIDIDLCDECYTDYEIDGRISRESAKNCQMHSFLAVPGGQKRI